MSRTPEKSCLLHQYCIVSSLRAMSFLVLPRAMDGFPFYLQVSQIDFLWHILRISSGVYVEYPLVKITYAFEVCRRGILLHKGLIFTARPFSVIWPLGYPFW